jgi:hypothetical protein
MNEFWAARLRSIWLRFVLGLFVIPRRLAYQRHTRPLATESAKAIAQTTLNEP